MHMDGLGLIYQSFPHLQAAGDIFHVLQVGFLTCQMETWSGEDR